MDLKNGESGIRTHDTREGMPVFKTGAINRSAISPGFKRKKSRIPYKKSERFWLVYFEFQKTCAKF